MVLTRNSDKKRRRTAGLGSGVTGDDIDDQSDTNYELVEEEEEFPFDSEDDTTEESEKERSTKKPRRKEKKPNVQASSTSESSASSESKLTANKQAKEQPFKTDPQNQQLLKRIEGATSKMYHLLYSKKTDELKALLKSIEETNSASQILLNIQKLVSEFTQSKK